MKPYKLADEIDIWDGDLKVREILWCIFGFPLMWVLLLLYAIFAIPVKIFMAVRNSYSTPVVTKNE